MWPQAAERTPTQGPARPQARERHPAQRPARPQVKEHNPGIQKLIFGGFGLPFGLAMIVICGGELYTSNAAFLPAALFEARPPARPARSACHRCTMCITLCSTCVVHFQQAYGV
jgi:hypothetical protein